MPSDADLQFRLLIDSVQDYAIFMVDPDGRVTSWNPAAERILGYRTGEILGEHVGRFHTPDDRAARRPERELEVARESGRFEEETWRVRKDGTRFWANVVITPIHDNGVFVGFAKVTRDLTARRDAEDERVRLAQAREAVRLRDEFLSIASHELRTPLTALDLQVQSLADRTGQLDPRVATKIQRIRKSSVRLQALVEALLDVSRLATGRFTINRTDADLVELVVEVADRLAEAAAAAGCQVTVEKRAAHARGRVDTMRVDQVVSNVLENALKFGAGKPVRVVVDTEGSDAVVTVIDHGPGIREEDRERIFGRFERAAPSRHFGGLGLGLYVSREIVTAHGGSIVAGADGEGGARITIRLPMDRASDPVREVK
ncbi:MAG: PAS domain-containing sensor histidine kinase [Polyangiaceae bacterium]|jgi:PAS domain S-box-containing protein